jgi:Mn2+/Fe2+ NRAMP family transporter
MNSEKQALPAWRSTLIISSLVCCILSVLGALVCFNSPFPLIPWGQGGYRTNPWGERVLWATVSTSILTVLLAFSGRGIPRILLIVSGVLLLVLSMFAYMANHV